MGRESLKKEKFSDAIKYFSLAIEIEPYDAKSYEYLAITYYNLSGNISISNKSCTLGELKYLFNNYVEYDDPLVRHTALVIAATSPGEYSIEQICKIYNYF